MPGGDTFCFGNNPSLYARLQQDYLMPQAQSDFAPRVLEIGPTPYLYAAFPQTTDYYSTWNDECVSEPAKGRRIVTLATLPGLARRLADPAYDVVAVHALPCSPWSLRSLGRSLFRRSLLRGSLPSSARSGRSFCAAG